MLQPTSAASSNPIQHKNWLTPSRRFFFLRQCWSCTLWNASSREAALHRHQGQLAHVKVIWESAASGSRHQTWRRAQDPSWSLCFSAKKQSCFCQPVPLLFLLCPPSPSPFPPPSHFTHLWMCLFSGGFFDPWVDLSSICYFLMPWGTPCLSPAHCGRAGEAGVVVLPACRPTPVLLTAHPSPRAQGIWGFQAIALAPASTTPSTQAEILLWVLGTGRLSLLEQGLPGTATSWLGGQPCPQVRCAPHPVSSRLWSPDWRPGTP